MVPTAEINRLPKDHRRIEDKASCPLSWRLCLPKNWDETSVTTEEERLVIRRRRNRARIPDETRHRPKAELAIEMIDQLTDWDITHPWWWSLMPVTACTVPSAPV